MAVIFNDIPNDVIILILNYLTQQEIARVGKISKRLNHLTKNPLLGVEEAKKTFYGNIFFNQGLPIKSLILRMNIASEHKQLDSYATLKLDYIEGTLQGNEVSLGLYQKKENGNYLEMKLISAIKIDKKTAKDIIEAARKSIPALMEQLRTLNDDNKTLEISASLISTMRKCIEEELTKKEVQSQKKSYCKLM